MRRSDRALCCLALPFGLAAFLLAGAAQAYCRTTSCMQGMPHTAQICVPPRMDDCGIPLFWAKPCVGFSVQKAASKKVTFAQTEQILTAAFATWTGAACPGGGTPHMQVTEAAPADCNKHEYNQMAGNANIILYHDDVWPYEGSANTLALTTVTYNLDTGEIYDADMELNSADVNFTVGDTAIDFDLLSIVTHETGHFLGLAHSADSNATMYPSYNDHTTNLRKLSPDDVAGICAIYPPGPPITGCDPTPRHGFSTLCAAQQTGGGSSSSGGSTTGGCCSVAPGSDGWSGRDAGVLAALGALLFAARRRSRSGLAPRARSAG